MLQKSASAKLNSLFSLPNPVDSLLKLRDAEHLVEETIVGNKLAELLVSKYFCQEDDRRMIVGTLKKIIEYSA